MLLDEVIEPATTEGESSIVFYLRKDRSFQFCVRYCKLNAVTIHDSCPLSRMDECINSLADARILSVIDAN